MDMKQINRIHDMITSNDREMQNLGIELMKSEFGEGSPLYKLKHPRETVINVIKARLVGRAYLLGKEFGEKIKKDYEKGRTGSGTGEQSNDDVESQGS